MAQEKRVTRNREAAAAKLARSIVAEYVPTEGCPPMHEHWFGTPLSNSDWLSRFARFVADNPEIAKAWKLLPAKCDKSYLIELAFAFAYPRRILVDGRRLNKQGKKYLDSIFKTYKRLFAQLLAFSDREEILHYSKRDVAYITDQIQHLAFAHERLEEFRASLSDSKAEERSFYLHMMANNIERNGVSNFVTVVTSLIEAACNAHGLRPNLYSDDAVKHRIQRYRTRLSLRTQTVKVTSPLSPDDEMPPF